MRQPKTPRKLFAWLLAVLLLLPAAWVPAAAKGPAELRLALISDPHVYPADMTGGFCAAFVEASAANGRAIESTQRLFEAALKDLKARAKKEKFDFLLVPGDMSEWGEYAGHTLVAKLLLRFEQETGVPVAVIPGNHDLSNGDASDFSTGVKEKARYLKHDEFPEVYAKLGYDLPGCERMPGTLSYAANLGSKYRLIAADTNRRIVGSGERVTQAQLRDWVLAECEKARTAGKIVIGMGHHNLGEMFGGQDTFMGENYGFGDAMTAAEAFADAGMHFYFSGHLHFNEIAMRVSDGGEPLYDIMTAASAFFPGGYRTVKFSTAGKKITADVRSHATPLTGPSPYPDNPYYDTFYGRSFGSPEGEGLAGWVRHAINFALGPRIDDLGLEPVIQTDSLLELINCLAEPILAMPVSKLPCTRFIGEFGFGDPNKPGTFEDLGNSVLIYLFGKRGGAAEDAFVQDALRRFRNGEFVNQLLKITAITPCLRETLSDTLYRFAGGVITSQSPTGGPDGVLVYDGPAEVPTGPDTFRLPQDVKITRGLTCAEITWVTRQSVCTPELIVTGKDKSPAPEAKISIESQPGEIMVQQLDIGVTKLMGRTQPVLKHTARVTGLKPGKAYCFETIS